DGGEPDCVDPHFVVFLATDSQSYVELPEGVAVVRSFADGSEASAECHETGGRGECIIACVSSDEPGTAIDLTWPCGSNTDATVRIESPTFMIEVDTAVAEAAVGCDADRLRPRMPHGDPHPTGLDSRP